MEELVDRLIDCGGVLSQMVQHGLEWEARRGPGLEPPPDTLAPLIRSVVGDVRRQYSKRDIVVAAKIVDQMTATIASEIFLVSPEFLEELASDESEPEEE